MGFHIEKVSLMLYRVEEISATSGEYMRSFSGLQAGRLMHLPLEEWVN